jgi:DNA modification methylase
MKTRHHIFFENSKTMKAIPSDSVDLVVTSPPYPMIEMWDAMFASQNRPIRDALNSENNLAAFELMHRELDQVWNEVYRVLKKGAIACINIGDATRSMGGNFLLYPNHSRIFEHLLKIGFTALPMIIWRKQTNAPTKFMGSGMLPCGAYVTLEHEYILILRKGPKREFNSSAEKQIRRESAIFWEERNIWYSDVWLDLKGTVQKLGNEAGRPRSAAFPFEIPYRLINMFSVKTDTVLDPFLGTGTTMWAAISVGRNSIGFEMDSALRGEIVSRMDILINFSNQKINDRIKRHLAFVRQRSETKAAFKYKNKHYQFPVMTSQETELLLNPLETIEASGQNIFHAAYALKPHHEFEGHWDKFLTPNLFIQKKQKQSSAKSLKRPTQLKLP